LGGNTCGQNCGGPADTTHGIGEIVQAPLTGQLTAAGFYVGSGVPTKIVIGTFATTPASTVFSCGSAGTDAGVNGGQSFTVQDVEALSGLALQAFNTVNLANPVTVTANQYVSILFMGGASTELMLLGTGASTANFDSIINFATSNPTVGNSYSTSASAGQCGPIVGGSFTPSGSTNTVVTQCYGNCGTPAITLVNTNSTHGINFNQSITLFYEFQSNINGFILNVTTSIAKNYNNGMNLGIAVYTIPGQCPQGQLPFTVNCPGIRQFAANSFTGTLAKGRFSAVAGSGTVPVVNGQWVAVAISGSISRLDLNDTNTNVPLLVTNGGPPMAPYITQSIASTQCPGCKMGLWAWINGNIVTSNPTPTPTGVCTNNFAQLDCMLPALTNGLCVIVTASCQTSSSLLWIIILTFLSFLLITVGFASAHVTKFVAAGDVFMFFFLAWFFIFAGIGLLQSFVIIFFLFIGAVAFGKTARNYF
jgi:hypothetical protein